MSRSPDPRRDPRSTAELVKAALAEAQQGDEAETEYPALSILHARGTRDVLEAGRALCASREARLRALGADILGQLGMPQRTFPEECCDALLAVLKKETNTGVLVSAVFALGHLRLRRAESEIIGQRGHREEAVRHAVAFALYGSESPAAVHALLELLEDPSEMVRDWAATSIGETVSLDGPRIREALLKHVEDEDEITRAEALHGLARRRDPRVLPFLVKELSVRRADPAPFIDAAKDFLGLGEKDAIGTKALLAALKSRQR
ncbi:HEAT repeat domain-containing protein [Reyranella sp.]|jgi:HEAT repeat protein|uniref:HEAT repeat domain-containing protein n=1 Tax=Reyranella sp. TaxID=1929291 RepID=UPI002F9307C6